MLNESFDKITSTETVTAAGKGPCWDGYKQVGMKKGKDGKMVPNCVPVGTSISEFATKRTISQTPAPKKDRVKGSSKNKKGSASSAKAARKVKFSAGVEKSLKEKVKNHNAKSSKKVTLGKLKAVYRRGAGAYSVSHRPGMNRNQWAMGRVNAFLKLVRSGKPANSAYKADNDLLPSNHARSTKKSASVVATGLVPEEKELAKALLEISQKYGKFNEDATGIWAGYTPAAENKDQEIGVHCANCVLYAGQNKCQIISLPVEPMGVCRFAVLPDGVIKKDFGPTEEELENYSLDKELEINIKTKEEYDYPEDAILAMAEYSGFGYESEHAIRAAWLRGVRNGEDPFQRAYLLASLGYESLDADLLPVIEEEEESNE